MNLVEQCPSFFGDLRVSLKNDELSPWDGFIQPRMTSILFLGLGSIGRRHLRLLRELEEPFEFLAYRSGTGTEYNDLTSIEEYEDLSLALAADPDIAFVTNPPHLHVDVATTCAHAGCHLFIEKPLSDSIDRIDELLSVVDERCLVTMMGCQFRYDPVMKQTKKLIEDDIGPVYAFRAESGSYLPDWRPYRDYRETYSAKRDQGGGVIFDLIHELDYVQWLFGGVDVVTAKTGQVSHLEIETEDVSEIVLETHSGAMGSVHLDYFRPVPKRTFEVVGRDGVISGDLLAGTLKLTGSEDDRVWSFDYDRDDLHRAQLKDFLRHVERGEPPENDVHDGRKVLELALEAKGEE